MSTAVTRLDDAMQTHVEAGNPMRAITAVRDAAMLFRFDRRPDALRKLDAALERLNGAWGRTMDADRRSAAIAAVGEARRCVETHRPPPLATLLVQTFLLDPDAPRGVGARAGVYAHYLPDASRKEVDLLDTQPGATPAQPDDVLVGAAAESAEMVEKSGEPKFRELEPDWRVAETARRDSASGLTAAASGGTYTAGPG